MRNTGGVETGFTSVRIEFAVGIRSLPWLQCGVADGLRATHPEAIVLPFRSCHFVGAHSLEMLLGAPHVLGAFTFVITLVVQGLKFWSIRFIGAI